MDVIIFLKMNLSTKEQLQTKMQKLVLFVKKNFKLIFLKIKNTLNFKIIVFIHGNIEVLYITYVI